MSLFLGDMHRRAYQITLKRFRRKLYMPVYKYINKTIKQICTMLRIIMLIVLKNNRRQVKQKNLKKKVETTPHPTPQTTSDHFFNEILTCPWITIFLIET